MYSHSAAKAALGLLMPLIVTMPVSINSQAGAGTILSPSDLQTLFPAAVFYRGQSAPAQLRNSGGVKLTDGLYVLASLVDTSGYSSGVAQKYQGYLITEVSLDIGGKHLPAGAYGFGFIADHQFVITDLGGHDAISTNFAIDDEMKRPRPLQFSTDPAGGFRLYEGRSYIRWTVHS